MNRRSFILQAGSGLLASALLTQPLSATAARSEYRQERAIVDHVFSRPESARRIGQQYLAKHPGHRSVDILTAELFNCRALRRRAFLSRLQDDTLASRLSDLKAQIQSDFDEGRIEVLEGVVWARTEAQLCALAALLA